MNFMELCLYIRRLNALQSMVSSFGIYLRYFPPRVPASPDPRASKNLLSKDHGETFNGP